MQSMGLIALLSLKSRHKCTLECGPQPTKLSAAQGLSLSEDGFYLVI